MAERQLIEEQRRREQEAAEEQQKRIEMEEFEKKYGTKKPKERKQRQVNEEETRNWGKISAIVIAVLVPLVGGLYLFLK